MTIPTKISLRTAAAYLLYLLLALSSAATILGFAGRLWWMFDIVSHFRVQYGLVLIICVIVALLLRQKRITVLAMVFAAANLSLILPLYLPQPEHQLEQLEVIRTIVANVHTANHDYDSMSSLIKKERPDLVVLIEVNQRWMDALNDIEDLYPYIEAFPQENNFGIAVMSMIPLDESVITKIGDSLFPSVIARMTIEGRQLTVIGTHPYPPVGPGFTNVRNQQLAAVAAFAAAQSGEVILMGDMNLSSWSPYFMGMIRRGNLHDSRKGFGVQPSWHARMPGFLRIPLDHILVSDGIQVHDRRLGLYIGSDHLPVIMDFSLSNAE